MVPTASAILAENNCIRCSCTSRTFEDHRRSVLEKAADSITERPAGITNRSEAADVLYWATAKLLPASNRRSRRIETPWTPLLPPRLSPAWTRSSPVAGRNVIGRKEQRWREELDDDPVVFARHYLDRLVSRVGAESLEDAAAIVMASVDDDAAGAC